jgi:hypothetical protein
MHGLSICIETPKGQRRRPDWPELAADYGYIKKTNGADGEGIDVFVGPHRNSEMVYVIDQCCKDGTFDEHKVMLGYNSNKKAIEALKSSYSKGCKVGKVTSMTIGQFKSWLDSGNLRAPIRDQVSRYMFNWDGNAVVDARVPMNMGNTHVVPQLWAQQTQSPYIMSSKSQMPGQVQAHDMRHGDQMPDGVQNQPWHMSRSEFRKYYTDNMDKFRSDAPWPGMNAEDHHNAFEFRRNNWGPEAQGLFKQLHNSRPMTPNPSDSDRVHLMHIAHAMSSGHPVHPDAISEYPRDIVPKSQQATQSRGAM